ncbi:hypothetical protein QE152_g12392 [Popillia japonica]|uniref:Transposase n=1 Tax=Popillia japonica TaxID=7064 RepID=A0AAW1LJC2_POPJA
MSASLHSLTSNHNEKKLVHRYILQELMKNHSKSAAIKLTAKQLGIGERTVWDIVKEIDSIGNPSSPPKKRSRTTIYDDLDEGQKSAIRRHVHSFFLRNELPTCTKILDVVNADDTLPELKRTTLWKVLKKLGFKWEKRIKSEKLPTATWKKDALVNWLLSKGIFMKSKHRARLIVEKELLVALSSMTPRFEKLCADKQPPECK